MAQLQVAIVPVTSFQQNCAIIWDVDTMQAAVFDPGGNVDRIMSMVRKLKVNVETILPHSRAHRSCWRCDGPQRCFECANCGPAQGRRNAICWELKIKQKCLRLPHRFATQFPISGWKRVIVFLLAATSSRFFTARDMHRGMWCFFARKVSLPMWVTCYLPVVLGVQTYRVEIMRI